MENTATGGTESASVETSIEYDDLDVQEQDTEETKAAPKESDEEEAVDEAAETEDSESEEREKKSAKAQKKPEPKAKEKANSKGKTDSEGSDDPLVLRVDGKTVKARDINHLRQLAMKGLGSEKRFQEAHDVKSKALQLFQLAEKDPRAFFQLTKKDPYKFAYDLLNEKIQYEEMDENQRKIYDYEQRLKASEEEKRQLREAEVRRRRQYEEQQVAQELDNKMLDSLKKSGLPKHKFYVQQIAATLIGAARRDEELSVEDATDIVKKRTVRHFQELVGQMDAKAIRAFLGPDNLKKLLDAEVKRVTDKTAPTVKSASRPGPAPAPAAKKDDRPLSPREWDEYIESLKQA